MSNTSIERDFSNPYAVPDPNAGDSAWSDIPKAFGAGALGIGADLGALVRELGESREDPDAKAGQAAQYLGQFTQEVFSDWEDGALDSLTPDARARIQSSVTDPNFWSLTTLALKGSQTAPSIAAVIVPSMIFPGAMAATASAAISGGAFSAGAMVDDVFEATQALDDAKLQEQAGFYKQLREQGVDEAEARRQYNQQLIGMKPAMLAVLGAVTSSVGAAGQVARGVAGRAASITGTAETTAGRIGKGVAEGAGSEAVQSTGESIVGQQALVDGELRDDINYADALKAGAEGAILGGAFGAAASGLAGRGKVAVNPIVSEALGNPEAIADTVVPGAVANPTVTPVVTPSVDPAAAAGQSSSPGADAPNAPPVTTPQVDTAVPGVAVAPVSASVTNAQERQAQAKFGIPYADLTPDQQAQITGRKAKVKVEVVDPAGINEEQALALGAGKEAPTPAVPVDAPIAIQQEEAFAPGPAIPSQNTEVPAGVPVEPVQDSPVGQNAPVEPAVAQPEAMAAPVEQAPVAPAPRTGPRILEDRTATDQTGAWADRVGTNIQQAEAPAVMEPTGKNYTAEQRATRARTNEGALQLTEEFKPSEIDHDAYTARDPKKVTAARTAVLNRAREMVARADSQGITIPTTIRDSANSDTAYNDSVKLLVEAKALAKKQQPTKADYQRFLSRELDIRAGDAASVVAARRAEGDAAMRQTGDMNIDDVVDTTATDDNPEAQIMRQEEEASSTPDRRTARLKEIATTAERRQAQRERQAAAKPPVPAAKPPAPTSEAIPASVTRALDKAMGVKSEPVTAEVTTLKVGPKVEVLKNDRAARSARIKAARASEVKPETKPETKPAPKAEETPQERSKRIVNDIKAKVAAARGQTNTAPTEAQKEAGNYAKGKVTIEGNSITIENPKGSTRSGTSATGRAWKIKLPVDYGYINGTKGVDGDPVDVYVGPAHDATYVYVVDQVDPDSRAFDEHKVMVGFRTEGEALATYDKAFSDGSGMLRVGSIAKMTHAEFKTWVHSPRVKTEAAEVTQADILEAIFEPEPAPAPVVIEDASSQLTAIDPITKAVVPVRETMSVESALDTTSLKDLSGAERVVAGQARRLLADLVGDTPVHIVSRETMARIAGTTVERAPLGLHNTNMTDHAIYINESIASDPTRFRHAVLHEATHAGTVIAIETKPTLKREIFALMTHVNEGMAALSEADQQHLRYAMSQPREFIAEVWSNPDVQRVLQTMPANDVVANHFKLDTNDKTMWGAMISTIRRALGMPKGGYSLLEASIRATERSFAPSMEARNAAVTVSSMLENADTKGLFERAQTAINDAIARPDMQATAGQPWALRLRTFDNLARSARRYFGGNNVMDRLYQAVERRRTRAKEHMDRAAPLEERSYRLQKRFEKMMGQDGKSVWENFTTLVYDETSTGVFADRPISDQKHISNTGNADAWKRAQHPDLEARYEALPQELKDLRQEAQDYFKSSQEANAKLLIENRIVKLFDFKDPKGVAQRIFDGTVTDAEKAIMGEVYDTIAAAGVLGKINGPYTPLMRRGNFVVKGRYKIAAPTNGMAIGRNEFAFKTAEEAARWAEKQSGRVTPRTVYADKTTGERFGVTPDGTQVALTAQDVDAVPSYRVTVQDEHMEMHDTINEARTAVAALRATGMDVDDAVQRSFENSGANGDVLSTQVARLVTVVDRRATARNYTDTQREDLRRAMEEVSLHMLASTRIQSQRLPRQYVKGYSTDFTRNMTDYTTSMANHLATLETSPQIDTLLAEMDEYQKNNAKDGFAQGRQVLINEAKARLTASNAATEGGAINNTISRILAISFIDKLASPAYSIINATQNAMITTPFLVARYGPKAAIQMARAYNDIGSLKSIREGFASTIAKAKDGNYVATDPVSLIMGRLKDASERRMLEVMIERGALDVNSGLEVAKLTKRKGGVVGGLDVGIGYLEGISRQMPGAIEAINRTAAALTAYRLEMERSGGNVDLSTQYAQDVVNQTHFNYSSSNTPPIFNHPVLKLALQFKKYGQGMYQLLGEQMAIAYRNENPGDRAQAIKSLSYTVGMHVLMAGAMGLPTEPIKLVLTAANGLGLIGWAWSDVEDAQRELAAELLGKTGGEMLTRGITRGIGIDLSTRMGIDTLMGPFGEPRSNEAQDWKAYAWDAFSGAPAGLIADWGKGINNLAQGNVLKAVEQLVPLKAFSDSVKAYRTYTEGNTSNKTGKQIMSPYSVPEAVGKALGFTPAREAENYERQNTFYRAKGNQDEARSAFQKEWIDATGAARGRLWRDIQKWNKGQDASARITLPELRGYQKRVKRDMAATKEGIRARKREQHIIDRADTIFNYQ